MPIISLLKKYKKKESIIIFNKSIKFELFFFTRSIKVYNGKEIKEIKITELNKQKIGSLVQTRLFRNLKKKKKIKKKK